MLRLAALFVTIFLCALVITSGEKKLWASTESSTSKSSLEISHLQDLAKEFVRTLGPAYENISEEESEKIQNTQNLSTLPDGASLLLLPRTKDLTFDSEIFSIKKNNRIYMALEDFIFVFDLPITYDPDTGIASGWFLREDWNIEIDLQEREVISRGETFQIYEDDILVEDGLTYVASRALTNWTGFTFDYDLSQQYVYIDVPYPLPAIDRFRREDMTRDLRVKENRPILPRAPQMNEKLKVAALNINQRVRYNKSGSSGTSTTKENTNLTAEGQIMGVNSRINISRAGEEGIETVTTRFSERSEEPDLLGPLKATYYEFGDISSTPVALSRGTSSALGVRVSNSPLRSDDFTTTIIEGNSLPDWDVELYRNGALISTQRTDNNGRYRFEEIPLFAGDNNFRILFFGLQGEIREETLNIPVTENLIVSQENNYDVSLTFDETQSYIKEETADEGVWEPDLAVKYSTSLGGKFVFLGLRNRHVSDERRTFLSAGTAFVANETIFNSTFGIDNNAELSGRLTARRELGEWDISTAMSANTQGYGIKDDRDQSIYSTSFTGQRAFDDYGWLDRPNILLDTKYNLISNGNHSYDARASGGATVKRFNTNIGLAYKKRSVDDELTEEVQATFNTRRKLGKFFLRGGFDYSVAPQTQVERYHGQIYYNIDPRKRMDLLWDYNPIDEFSTTRLNMTYENDYFRTTPFVEVTSEDDMRAGLNVNFSLVNTPSSSTPMLTSDRVIGRGMLEAFVYLDHNGNLTFDEDIDEPLEDVVIQSVNARKRGTTNEKGFTTLTELPSFLPTDIKLEVETLPDFLMVPARDGRSILPVGGQIYDLDFPVHMAGEVDGTTYIMTKDNGRRVLGNFYMTLQSLNPDWPKREYQAQAAFDGFYLFTRVPPGQYLLIPRTPGQKQDRGNPVPEIITIGYEGDIIAEKNLMFRETLGFVDYDINFAEGSRDNPQAKYDYKLLVRTQKKSELGSLIQRIIMKTYIRPLLAHVQQAEISQDYKDEGYDGYTGEQEKLHKICNVLITKNIDCKIAMTVYDEGEWDTPLEIASRD